MKHFSNCYRRVLGNLVLSAITFAMPCIVNAETSQDNMLFNHLGVGIHANTTGFGGELAVPASRYAELRAGVTVMPGFSFSTNANGNIPVTANGDTYEYPVDMDMSCSLSRVQGLFIVDAYPFGTRNDFHISAGLYFGGADLVKVKGQLNEIPNEIRPYLPQTGSMGTIEIGDYDIPIDSEGRAQGSLRAAAVRPYVGLGYGRYVGKSRVKFSIDLGCQFMGHMKVYSGGKEMKEVLDKVDDDWSKWMDKLTVYPVLNIAITCRLF